MSPNTNTTTTHENYDPFFPDQTVVDLYLPLWATLPAFQSKPAFIWTPTQTHLTYSQLNTSAHFISQNLLSFFHLNKGDTILLLCSPGIQFVEILFACQRAGFILVPIYPLDIISSSNSTSTTNLVKAILQTKPKAAIADSGYIARVRKNGFFHDDHEGLLIQSLLWIPTEELLDLEFDHNINIVSSYYGTSTGCNQDDVYLIQYTSGATGNPKPVIVTAGAAAHNVRAARKAYDLHPNSVIVSWLPQYHDCGLMFLLLTVVSGATCVMTSPMAFLRRPRIWLDMVSEFRGSCTPVPSFALALVMKRGGIEIRDGDMVDLSSLKNLIVINEPIYSDDVEEFVDFFKGFGLNPMAIAPSYGLAENCTFVSTAWINNNELSLNSFPKYKKLLPSGRLSSMTGAREEDDIKIVIVNEETGELMEDGTEGEIWVSSPSNASGYLGHPSLTQEIFHRTIKNTSTNSNNTSFVRTGDRGIVMGQERFLYVTGRSADVIKRKSAPGEVHPHYIETAAYKSCRNVLRGGCIAAFETAGGMITVTAELTQSVKKGDVGWEVMKEICKGIEEGVRKEVGVGVWCVAIVKSGSIPKTTSGKIKRWAARVKFLGGEMDVLTQMEFGHESNDDDDVQEKEREAPILSHNNLYPKHPFILSSL